MLNELQPDLLELIDLVRAADNYDTTLAAAALASAPIPAGADAVAERAAKASASSSRAASGISDPRNIIWSQRTNRRRKRPSETR